MARKRKLTEAELALASDHDEAIACLRAVLDLHHNRSLTFHSEAEIRNAGEVLRRSREFLCRMAEEAVK